MSIVISVRVRKELKEEAEKLGINFKQLFEKALEEAIAKEKKIVKAVEEILENLENLTEEEWVNLVKESRKSR